ncbi:hypothetical protein BME96_05535 [Virgibacillus halodenitrificans]|uniref:Cytochrome c oxidase subunit 4 n=1 Tax=Virgibacillus halodenitrificans TaxID=1482 RepID=A0AAC9J0K7_VIRHA|nr:hypothetical protein [Virgibacillus halodenitrificans]APC47660.1 hypothetical protein BME96_05535 [Virgibacillus halodenitrificans]
MMGLLNIGSLILGIVAWVLPAISLLSYDKTKVKKWPILSITACALALCFQIIYNYHLVKIQDWAALLDTTGAVVFASVVLLSVTVLLNAITFIKTVK